MGKAVQSMDKVIEKSVRECLDVLNAKPKLVLVFKMVCGSFNYAEPVTEAAKTITDILSRTAENDTIYGYALKTVFDRAGDQGWRVIEEKPLFARDHAVILMPPGLYS